MCTQQYYLSYAHGQAARRSAVALCKRHSRDAAPDQAQALWFGVLQTYVDLLRTLRARQRVGRHCFCSVWRCSACHFVVYKSLHSEVLVGLHGVSLCRNS